MLYALRMKKPKPGVEKINETAVISVVDKRANALEADPAVIHAIIDGVRAKLTLQQMVESAINGQRVQKDTDAVLQNVISLLIRRCVANNDLSEEEVAAWKDENHHTLTNGNRRKGLKKSLESRNVQAWTEEEKQRLITAVTLWKTVCGDKLDWGKLHRALTTVFADWHMSESACRNLWYKTKGAAQGLPADHPDVQGLTAYIQRLKSFAELEASDSKTIYEFLLQILAKAEARTEPLTDAHRETLYHVRDALMLAAEREGMDETESSPFDDAYIRCQKLLEVPKKTKNWSSRGFGSNARYVKVGENGTSFKSKM